MGERERVYLTWRFVELAETVSRMIVCQRSCLGVCVERLEYVCIEID